MAPATSRRTFLAASGAALAAPSLIATPPPARDRAIRRALKLYMVQGEGSLQDKFARAKAAGFDGIELDSPNGFARDEVLAARDATGLLIEGVVLSVHWQKPFSHPSPAVRAEAVAALRTALHDAKAYGADSVLVVPAVVNAKVSYQAAYERSQRELRKVLELAGQLEIRIAFENVWNNFLLSPLEFARYIDELESPWVCAHFDVGNIVKYGWPTHWIETLGTRIHKVDVKEYGHKKGFGVDLTEGDVTWPEVMQAFDALGYEGWFAAEVRGGDDAYLKDVAERMGRILAM